MDEVSLLYQETTLYLTPSPLVEQFLIFMRLLPPKGDRFTWKLKLKFFIFNVIVFTPLGVGLLSYLIKKSQDGPDIKLLNVYYLILQADLYFLGIFLVYLNIDKFQHFKKNASSYKFGYPQNLLERSQYLQKWNIFVIILSNIMGCCHVYASFYMEVGCSEEILKSDERYICDVGFPAWYPVKIDNKYLKGLLIFDKWFATCFITSAITFYVPFGEFIILIGLRLQHLRILIRKIDFRGNPETTEKKLIFCIRYHTEISRLATQMNNSIGYLLITEYFKMVFIALAEYEIFIAGYLTSIVPCMIWCAGPILFAECGQMLEDQTEKLRHDVYGLNWYNMSPEIRNTFKLFLGKVQKPIHLITQPLMIMNRTTLWNLMQGSVNLMMYLKNFT